jgi:RNA polymerase sigma-70 factor (ECF subfamily)
VQFPAWIYAITTRKCADAIRKAVRARRLNASLQAEAATTARGSDTDTAAELDLASGIAGLPQDQRAVVYLFYGEDLGIEEIAATLDIPAGTVKSRLHHARNALKRYMRLLSTVTQIGRTRHDRHR